MTPVAPCDSFLGRIKTMSVPPPRTVKAVKRSISKLENIKDRESTTLFLSPCSQSPLDDAEKITILNGTGPGLGNSKGFPGVLGVFQGVLNNSLITG